MLTKRHRLDERSERPWATAEHRPPTAPSGALTHRIRAEFLEMPGLCLTLAQAARFWNLERPTAQIALAMLERAGVLRRRDDGQYMRADAESVSRTSRNAGRHARKNRERDDLD